MAFDSSNFAIISAGSSEGAPKLYSYKSSESLVDIIATGYFDDYINELRLGDIIYVYTDNVTVSGAWFYIVTSVTTNVEVTVAVTPTLP